MRRRFWWGILPKSSIQTTCDLPCNLPPAKTIMFDGVQTSLTNLTDLRRKKLDRVHWSLCFNAERVKLDHGEAQPNLMRSDDCTATFVDNVVFMAAQLRNVSADIKWTEKKRDKSWSWARDSKRDGPGRIRSRDHLLPRLLRNAPGALGGEGGCQVKNHCVGLRPAPCWSKSNSASYRWLSW